MKADKEKTPQLYIPPLGRSSSLLENLTDRDVGWLLSNGEEEIFYENATVLEEGEILDSLLIITEGLLGVYIPSLGDRRLAAIGSGEVIGERAFLEEKPSSARVRALETTKICAISRDVLREKIANDPPFAARFYRALAISISQRFKLSTENPGIDNIQTGEEETRTETWKKVLGATHDFKHLMYKADLEAIDNQDAVPEETAKKVLKFFREFVHFLNHALYDASVENKYIKEKIGYRAQQEILPYLLLTETAERFYSKPRGYPGDFLSLELVYRNSPSGSGRIGPLLDWCFLNITPSIILRYRRAYMTREITELLNENRGSVVRVTGIASGPADEIFGAYATLENPSLLKTTLIDFDSQALHHVRNKRNRLKLYDLIELLNFEWGRESAPIPRQDLVYCPGLMDYLSDKLALRLLNLIHSLLRPGGKAVLSNFHRNNPARAFMDFILEWKINHRTEEELNRLFKESHFRKEPSNITYDKNSVCMFAECIK